MNNLSRRPTGFKGGASRAYSRARYGTKNAARSVGNVARNVGRAAAIGIEMGYHAPRFSTGMTGLRSGQIAFKAGMEYLNMGAAYRALGSGVAIGTMLVTYAIPRGVKWLAKGVAKVGANVWRVTTKVVKSTTKYLWRLIRKVNRGVAEKIVYANRKNTKVNKNIFRPSTYTEAGRQKLGKAKAERKVKRTENRLLVAEAGLAGYGITTSLEKRRMDRAADEGEE